MNDTWTSRIPRFALEYRASGFGSGGRRCDSCSATQGGGEESLQATSSQV